MSVVRVWLVLAVFSPACAEPGGRGHGWTDTDTGLLAGDANQAREDANVDPDLDAQPDAELTWSERACLSAASALCQRLDCAGETWVMMFPSGDYLSGSGDGTGSACIEKLVGEGVVVGDHGLLFTCLQAPTHAFYDRCRSLVSEIECHWQVIQEAYDDAEWAVLTCATGN